MNVQLATFLLYFVVVFAIGWYAMRATRSEADYWIAGGKLGWLVGGATMAATHTSAGTFVGTIGVMYVAGWSFGWLVLALPLAYWFMAAVLAPRFTRVKQLTLPAFIETRYYSKGVRALAAVIILIATVVYVQAQIVAGGLIANIVFGVPVSWGMVGFTVILLAYTVIGGMIAVVYTDLLQLVIMVLGAICAVPLAIRQVGGVEPLFTYVEAVNPLTFSWEAMPALLLFTMALSFLLGGVATPEKLIRLYAMRDMRTIRRGILLTIIAVTSLNLMVFVLSLAAVVLFPNLPTGDLAMPMLATAVLPATLGAILLAAITAAMMSTVDSLLLVAGSALSVDIYQLFRPDAPPGRRLWVDRLGILVVGTIPVVLLLSGVGEGELVQFIVLLFTALMASSFFIPVVVGVYWRRATREGAAAAMVGGVTTALAWEGWGPADAIDPVLPGFLVSALLMVTVSLLTPPPPASATEPYIPAPKTRE